MYNMSETRRKPNSEIDAIEAEAVTVAASYSLTSSSTSNSTTPIPFDNQLYDTHSAVTSGAGFRFTVPAGKGGLYSIGGMWFPQTTSTIGLYKNGVLYGIIGENATTYIVNGTIDLELVASDYIDIRFITSRLATGGTWGGAAAISFVTIKRIGA